MNSGIVHFMRNLPAGTIIDIQQIGQPMIFGLVFQTMVWDYVQFTNWPGTAPGEIVRVASHTIIAIGIPPRPVQEFRLLSARKRRMGGCGALAQALG